MVSVLAFDLGGVLFSDGTHAFLNYLHGAFGVDRERAGDLLDGDLGSRYREGKLTRDEFWRAFRRTLGLAAREDDLEARWIDGYRLRQETRDLIRQLAPHYGVYYLSDNVADRVAVLHRRYGFLNLFDGGVFSHEAGVRKPDARIYELLLERTQVAAGQVLFVDDKEAALEPARRLGMRTVHYRDGPQLRRDLRRLGILRFSS
nr:HAD family phosphatase [uncultured Actinoplanes sp.]